MKLYAESSAVLAWLLDEPASHAVERALEQAESIVTSELTILEVERSLVRAEVLSALSEAEVQSARRHLHWASRHWHLHLLRSSVLDRACLAFPVEPIRSLDALHLASALELREALPGLAILSLDRRIQSNAVALGFESIIEI